LITIMIFSSVLAQFTVRTVPPTPPVIFPTFQIGISLSESALAKNAPITPLQSALTKSLNLKRLC
jgi:hypothetical protein